MALKGIMNPVLQEKAKITFEQREIISEYWVLVIPYLRLFFQGIADDPKCNNFLKALAKENKESFRELTKLFVIWFFYHLDRTVLRGTNDLLEDEKVKIYFRRVWFIDSVELSDITISLDNTKLEERQLVFCKLICDKLGNSNLLSTLMISSSSHMFGNLKLVLSLKQEDLIKLS